MSELVTWIDPVYVVRVISCTEPVDGPLGHGWKCAGASLLHQHLHEVPMVWEHYFICGDGVEPIETGFELARCAGWTDREVYIVEESHKKRFSFLKQTPEELQRLRHHEQAHQAAHPVGVRMGGG